MDSWLTTKEVTALESVSERTIRRKIASGGYEKVKQVKSSNGGRGGLEWRVHASCLSEAAQVAYATQHAGSALVCPLPAEEKLPSLYKGNGEGGKFGVGSSESGVETLSKSKTVPALTEKERTVALARADLVRLYLGHLRRARRGAKGPARASFTLAYNSGQAYPQVYAILGETSWQTIERWKVALRRTKDAFLLADRRGKVRRGSTTLSPDQMKILTACACHPNRPNLAEAIRMSRAVMELRGVSNGHSDDTYRRFLLDYRDRNFHIWTWMREGEKAWNDKVALSVERDITLLNVGDVLVADGHVLNFEVLNPWTGKPKRMKFILWYDMRSNYPVGWDIMPEEDTQAIASALRRAIIRLGKLPRVAYLDNGKAFGARFFQGVDLATCGFDGLFARLGIQTIFAWPYHGQSKTIERFFKTFGELERWMPTYVGTSIETKPPRLNRGEAIHRKIYDKIMGGQSITLEQAHRAIATWFDEYARRPQRGHLEGACPQEIFDAGKGPGVDRERVRELMLKHEIKQIRANGVSLFGRNYYAPELYGRRHPVMIGYDLQDPTSIEVYDRESGERFCTAHHLGKVHPAARLLGTEADQAKLEDQLAIKGAQRREARGPAQAFLEAEVLPDYRRMLEAQGLGPAQSAERIAQGGEAPHQITALDEERVMREVAELERMQDEARISVWDRLRKLDDADRYEALLEMEARSEELPPDERTFMRFFERSDRYQIQAQYWEDFRARAILAAGQ